MPKIIVLIVTLLSCELVNAQEYLAPLTAPEIDVYLDFSLNNNQLKGYPGFATGSDTGYRFLVGTTLGENSPWAIEGFVSNLGTVTEESSELELKNPCKLHASATNPDDIESCVLSRHTQTSASSMGVDLKYSLLLPSKTAFYLSAGIQAWDIDKSKNPTITVNYGPERPAKTSPEPNTVISETGVDPYFAFGITQHFMKKLAVSLEYAHYQVGDNSIPSTSLGLRYQFN